MRKKKKIRITIIKNKKKRKYKIEDSFLVDYLPSNPSLDRKRCKHICPTHIIANPQNYCIATPPEPPRRPEEEPRIPVEQQQNNPEKIEN